METPRVAVVELINLTRQEILVATTRERVPDYVKRTREELPAEVSHWSRADCVEHRTVEFSMPAEDVGEFVDGYAQALSGASWKITVLRS